MIEEMTEKDSLFEENLKRLMNYYRAGLDWYGFMPLLKVMWSRWNGIPITEQICKSDEWVKMVKYWASILKNSKQSVLANLNELDAEAFLEKVLIILLKR